MTQQAVDLQIGGMTCASCAARIEKKLNRMPGVAGVGELRHREGACGAARRAPDVDAAIATVEATGYTAPAARTAPRRRRPRPAPRARMPPRTPRSASLRRRLLDLRGVDRCRCWCWRWSRRCSSTTGSGCRLTLAAPVVVWGAWPFHRAAWANLRHGAATMDTLISLGVLAAFGWSLYALFFGDAGMPGMRMTFRLLPEPGSGAGEIYLEVAAAVTVFILAGRYFEARAKKQSGAALRALLDLGAKDVAVAAGRPRTADPGRPTGRGGPVRGPARGEDRHRRRGGRGVVRGRRQPAHRRTGSRRGRPRMTR